MPRCPRSLPVNSVLPSGAQARQANPSPGSGAGMVSFAVRWPDGTSQNKMVGSASAHAASRSPSGAKARPATVPLGSESVARWAASAHVPESHGAVAAATGQGLAVGRERDAPDCLGVPRERAASLARLQIHQRHSPVAARRRDRGAVRGNSDRANQSGWCFQGANRPFRTQSQDIQRAAGRHQGAAVGSEGECSGSTRHDRQQVEFASACRVPELQRLGTRADRQSGQYLVVG